MREITIEDGRYVMRTIDERNKGKMQVGFWYESKKKICSKSDVDRMSKFILNEFKKIKDAEGLEIISGPEIIFHSGEYLKHLTIEEYNKTTMGIKATAKEKESSIKLEEGTVPESRGWI